MKLRTNPFLRHSLLTAALTLTLSQAAMAADILWNGALTGTLDWNTSGNWTGSAIVNSATDRADLRKDWGTTPTINLSAPVIANGILFDDTGASGDSLLIIGNGGNVLNILTLGGTTPSIDVATTTLTISAGLAGTSGFTKSGAGILSLSGSNTGLSGAVVVSAGTLALGSTTALNSGSTLQVNSGTTLTVTSSNTIAGLNDNAGSGGSISQASGGGKTLTIAGSGNYSFSGNFTTGGSNKVGLLVTSTTVMQTLGGNNTANTGYQSVTGNGGALVFAKQNSIFQGLAAGAVVNGNVAANAGINVSSGGIVALGVGDSTNGYFDAAAIATFLDSSHMGASTTAAGFRANSLLGFDTTNATSGTFTHSTPLAQLGTSTGLGFAKLGAGTLILDAANTYSGVTQVRAGTLQIGTGGTSGAIASTASITLSSGATLASNRSDGVTLSNIISGAGGFSQIGGGTTNLDSTSNSLTGPVAITNGTLGVQSLGNSTVTLSSTAKQLVLNRSATFTNPIVISAATGVIGQGVIDTGSGFNATLSGPITINATPTNGGHFGASSTGSLTVTGAITSSVPVIFRRGTGTFSNGGTGYSAFQVRAGTVKLGTASGLATTASVAIGGDGAATLDLSGFNQSLVGITKGAQAATITNTGLVDSTLTTTGTSAYAGVLSDGSTNKLALTVSSGSLTLSGINTYTGATNVTAGTLVVDGNQSAATGAVTVASGATLGGSGTVGGATTIQSGGTLAVGNSPGLQTFSSNLTLNSGSIFDWDLNANNNAGTRGTDFDAVNVTGNLSIDALAVFRVIQNGGADFANVFWNSSRSFSNIFSVTGSTAASWSSTAVAVYNTSNVLQDVSARGSFMVTDTTLTWTAVPEPSSALAGLLLGAGLLRRRRSA